MSDDTMIRLKRDGERDLKFRGELIAKVGNSWDKASGDYSGSTGRKSVYRLYRTASGKFVAASEGLTQWQGEHDRYDAKVCETEAEVMEFFGHNRLAKELYEAADLDTSEVID